MREHTISKTIVSYFVRVLGIFLILFTAMAAILGFGTALRISQEGSTGVKYSNPEFSPVCTIISSSKDMPGYAAGIREGDTLTKINNIPVKEYSRNLKELDKRLIGTKVTFTVKKSGAETDIPVVYTNLPPQEKILAVLFRTFPVILMFAYVIVGLWGIFRNPFANETILIALFCFCFGCFMYATVNAGYDPDSFVRKYLLFDSFRDFVSYIMWYGSSFWLLLFVTFPKRTRFYERHKITAIIFIFTMPLVATLSDFFAIEIPLLGYLIITLYFLNMAIGVFMLNKSSKEAATALEKRQIRLMLFGIKYGAIAIGIGWLCILLAQFIFGNDINYTIMFISYIVFLIGEIGGLIIPFTFLNSFSQNRLLETEGALKRRVRYIAVTIGLLALYLLFIFIIGKLSVSIFEMRDPTIIIITVLLLSLTFTPINKRLLQYVDEMFYPERTKYSDSLKLFNQRITGKIETRELLDEFTKWVQSTIGISPVIPFAFSGHPSGRNPFRYNEKESVVHRIRGGNNFFWDEISERSRIVVDENEIDWVRENEISVTMPMISQGQLVGLVNLGKKQNDEDFSSEDLEIITQASNQTALALQNLNLQSEYIEKKRMDKELEMARNIQKRLMPQETPDVHGLDVAGESRPCFEVAGDYYDIINMEDGNTAMVVADVSGKGAGAAMIMANLQASVRVGIEISEDFGKFIERINNHIYKNTSPSEFITFFMGIWQPDSKTLFYVNAGHNPPVLIDKNNNVRSLDATGLILGILPGQHYEVKGVKIDEGSILLIYSDGLEEAMNPKNEFFGTERIIKSVIVSKDKQPDEIISYIQKQAIVFCDGKALHDDLTMIVAKRL
jgi:phosphoserine phosphatase RsbU/P